jgi:hypothetical protein
LVLGGTGQVRGSAFGEDHMTKPIEEISRLIDELDSLKTGESAAARLVEHGPAAILPLRKFLYWIKELPWDGMESRAALANLRKGSARYRYRSMLLT